MEEILRIISYVLVCVFGLGGALSVWIFAGITKEYDESFFKIERRIIIISSVCNLVGISILKALSI